ncbi:hypothetical protein JTE90_009040 [Oedothorax gibbosus]|uniref:Uncharacterized protein n=1 Tax=Oedothorax gibbosus TaxID=931172 RepID=A0AAV6VLJ1_9ARAC|nr:hypothetical protein JTE90_009040 [Oedothorax gibbosus]
MTAFVDLKDIRRKGLAGLTGPPTSTEARPSNLCLRASTGLGGTAADEESSSDSEDDCSSESLVWVRMLVGGEAVSCVLLFGVDKFEGVAGVLLVSSEAFSDSGSDVYFIGVDVAVGIDTVSDAIVDVLLIEVDAFSDCEAVSGAVVDVLLIKVDTFDGSEAVSDVVDAVSSIEADVFIGSEAVSDSGTGVSLITGEIEGSSSCRGS